MEITQQEYNRLKAKQPTYRVMGSPSHGHFQSPKLTHLHSVCEIDDATDEIVVSFIQRGSKVKFYKGAPTWTDWMKPITAD